MIEWFFVIMCCFATMHSKHHNIGWFLFITKLNHMDFWHHAWFCNHAWHKSEISTCTQPSSNQCWVVLTFLWESAGSSSLMMLWEPDWFSNTYTYIYIYIYRAGENRSGYQIFIVCKLTRFSDKSVLIYTSTSWLLKELLVEIKF